MGETERSSAAALQALPEPFVAFDVSARHFVMVNAAAERLLGYTRDELLTMGPDALLETAEAARLALAYESITPGVVTRREWVVRRKDGRALTIGVTSIPVMVDSRLIIHMLVRDLSDEDPAAAQRTLLALAYDRLATTLDYAETLQAIEALVVPRLADACTIEVSDASHRLSRIGDVTTAVPPPTVDEQAWFGSVTLSENGEAATFALYAHGRELGTITLYRHPPRTWHPDAQSLALALARRAGQAVGMALLWQTTQRELARRDAIHRISRAFADSEPGSDRAMAVLLNEGMAMLGGDHGGIALWDAPSRRLIQVYSSTGRSNGLAVGLDNSLSGAAARSGRPVISNAYQQEYGRGTPGGRFGAQSGVAVPLMHEGRLLGVISIGTRTAGRVFTTDDTEALETLSGMAASMFGTLERAQLHAISMAAREVAHRLNNDLAPAVGAIDYLRNSPGIPEELRQLVSDAADGLERAAQDLTQLQQVVRFQTRETPIGPVLDLDRSTGPDDGPI